MALFRRKRPVDGSTLVSVFPYPTQPACLPHGILEQLRQDVIQWHGDEGEAGSHVSIDADPRGIAILVLTQASVDIKVQ